MIFIQGFINKGQTTQMIDSHVIQNMDNIIE